MVSIKISILIVMLCWTSLVSSQDSVSHSIFTEIGFLTNTYHYQETDGKFRTPRVFNYPLIIGYSYQNQRSQHSLAYQYLNLRIGSPYYDERDLAFPYSWYGPNHSHSIDYCFDYFIRKEPSKRFNASISIGTTQGLIMVDSDSKKYNQSDTLYNGRYRERDSSDNVLFALWSYERFTSKLLSTLNFGASARFKIGKHSSLSLRTIFNFGLLEINRTNFWFEDNQLRKKGQGIMTTRGGGYGVRFRYMYTF